VTDTVDFWNFAEDISTPSSPSSGHTSHDSVGDRALRTKGYQYQAMNNLDDGFSRLDTVPE